jgi:hypothetical protein
LFAVEAGQAWHCVDNVVMTVGGVGHAQVLFGSHRIQHRALLVSGHQRAADPIPHLIILFSHSNFRL